MKINKQTKGILFASGTAMLWGFLAIAIKVAIVKIDPYTMVWFRFAFAFLLMFTFFGIKNPQALKILYKPPLKLVIASLALGVNYILFVFGLELTGANSVQILIQMAPIILIIVSIIMFKEHLSKRQVFGIMLASIGFYFFYQQQLETLMLEYQDFKFGVFIIFLSACSWVLYAVIQKILVKTHQPQQLNLFLYFLPAVLFIPFANFELLLNLEFGDYLLLSFLGLNTLLAYGFLAEAFKNLEANKISMIVTQNPIITLVTMTVLYHLEVEWVETELTSPLGFVGAGLVIIGAITAILSAKRVKK